MATVGVDCRAKRCTGRCARLLVPERVGLAGSVPVGVGARYEHPRVADGENVYLVADDFVQDAIGGSDDQLTQTIDERRRLELARGVDVHQRVTDG